MKANKIFFRDNKQKIKDLAFNIGAILLLNVTIQFVLYPFIQRRLGNDGYGVALSLLAFVSITSNTLGGAANYSRMVEERVLHPANGDYNLFLVVSALISAAGGAVFLYLLHLLTPVYFAIYALLILMTAFRYYADVPFKLSMRFAHYFLFYAMISLGYIGGLFVYRLTGNWMSAILTGEAFGVLYAGVFGGIFRRPFKISPQNRAVLGSLGLLTLSGLFENLTLNADRLVLLALSGGESVSIYYTASLFGKVAALLTVPLNALLISYLVRYDKGLTRRMWSVFALSGGVLGGAILGGCMLGSVLILPILYPGLYTLAKPYFFAAIFSQVLYFVSGVLLVVLLRFRGEKKQFIFNLCYGAEFFALTIVATAKWGLDGFVWASLLANALRLGAVMLWGFCPDKKDAAAPPDEAPQ